MRLPAYLPARLPAWSLTATPTATATARRDRAPYITTLRNGTASTIPAWNFINGNFFLANYNPSLAIDNDDGSSFWQHHGNFIVYGQAGLKFGAYPSLVLSIGKATDGHFASNRPHKAGASNPNLGLRAA